MMSRLARLRRGRLLAGLLTLLGPVAAGLAAQDSVPATAPAAAAGTTATAPGAQVTFTAAAGGAIDRRVDRLIALHVAAGESPSALLAPGAFTAVWETSLEVPLRSDVTFAFSGTGRARLVVNDQPVLEETGPELGAQASGNVRLAKGPNRVRVEYTSPAAGDATFALQWQGRGFSREPVPPMALRHDPTDAALVQSTLIREGRELVAAMHCLRCHHAPDLAEAAKMPELALGPPYLGAAGERFQGDWLAAWIADPHALRPGTRMPKLALTAQETADITAYLLADAPAPAAAATPDRGLIDRGAHLFADLQCAGCHALPGRPAEAGRAPWERVSLAQVPVKWQPAALQAYLLEPEALHAGSRMPNFQLAPDEAAALTAFLLSLETPVQVAKAAVGDAIRGQDLFLAKGCLNCHAPGGPAQSTEFAALLTSGGWNRGCVAESPAARGTAPDFAFTARQREALRTFATHGIGALAHDAPAEFSARQWHDLRCASCHARDGENAVYSALTTEREELEAAHPGRPPADEGEESSVDPYPPMLTWAGEKLRPEWTERLLAGNLDYRSRPWLAARMPVFASRATPLAAGLAAEHGVGPVSPPLAAGTPEQIEIGRHLASAEAFNCLACHGVGDIAATAPFGAPGVNFAHTTERLRQPYFVRWMDNPLRVVPGTKMPKFTDTAGRTLQADILDGDTRAQWDALFAYLHSVQSNSTPSP